MNLQALLKLLPPLKPFIIVDNGPSEALKVFNKVYKDKNHVEV